MRVRLATYGLLVLLLPLLISEQVPAAQQPRQENEADREEIAVLIRQLEAPKTADRDRAVKQLIELGPAIQPQIEAALEKARERTRRRLELILLAYDRRRAHRKLEKFQAFIDGDDSFAPPGWSNYRRSIGDDAICRKLLVAMYKAEPELMEVYENDPAKAAKLFEERFYEWLRLCKLKKEYSTDIKRSRAPLGVLETLDAQDPASMLVFFFVFENKEIHISSSLNDEFAKHVRFQEPANQLEELLFPIVLERPKVDTDTLKVRARWGLGPPTPEQEKLWEKRYALQIKFALRWLRRPFEEGPGRELQIRRRIMQAMRADLKGELPFLMEQVKSRSSEDHDCMRAVVAIANLGNRSHVPVLEPLLLCDEVVRQTKSYSIQVRDVALGALVHMTDQALDDYGYNSKQMLVRSRRDGRMEKKLMTPFRLAFQSDSQRQKALAKWHAWAEENLNKEKKAEAEAAR